MWELRIDDEVCGEGPLRPFSQRPKYGGQRANERGPGDGDPAEVVVCCGGGAQRRAASGQGQWGGWAGPECVLEHGESDATHLQSRVLGGREGARADMMSSSSIAFTLFCSNAWALAWWDRWSGASLLGQPWLTLTEPNPLTSLFPTESAVPLPEIASRVFLGKTRTHYPPGVVAGMGLPAWGERQRERRSDRAAAQRDGHWSS